MSYTKAALIARMNCDHCAGEGRVCALCGCGEASGACDCPLTSFVECPHCALEAYAEAHPLDVAAEEPTRGVLTKGD